ncbi:MAG: hydrolase [Acidobacteria bacterium]|nr:MAG: hydrolase [Acidobacteriota bacterium]
MAVPKTALPATPVLLNAGSVELAGDVRLPDRPRGLVVFAHGSGSSRHSSRNVFVAEALGAHGFGTLLMDLLTRDEEFVDQRTAHLRFDVGLLGSRVAHVIDWLDMNDLRSLPIGLFGASTGAAAMSRAEVAIEIVPGATHLFEEPGALDQVARHAADWFDRHLPVPAARPGTH